MQQSPKSRPIKGRIRNLFFVSSSSHQPVRLPPSRSLAPSFLSSSDGGSGSVSSAARPPQVPFLAWCCTSRHGMQSGPGVGWVGVSWWVGGRDQPIPSSKRGRIAASHWLVADAGPQRRGHHLSQRQGGEFHVTRNKHPLTGLAAACARRSRPLAVVSARLRQAAFGDSFLALGRLIPYSVFGFRLGSSPWPSIRTGFRSNIYNDIR
ncbi:hypothetical protein F5X68DRAFT_74276 [Plectosphaerella plurivora]|uniref:Uncharacterized protein n=1 Tax=Plectosphaerella plurivora TaxID=936078 RepID=A0A9P9ACM8_9PEZI|nr:hypothetical protein F5X68DRAFT_74276 [Plectosphaerella plurivora]